MESGREPHRLESDVGGGAEGDGPLDREAGGAELHLDDGVMAVPPMRCGREADEVARPDLGQDALEGDGGHVVALVHDDVAVAGDEISDPPAPGEALESWRRRVARSARASPADLADRRRVDPEERGELSTPLVQQRLPVHEDEGAPTALRDQVCAKRRSCRLPGVL
jgi:hypothetical protein